MNETSTRTIQKIVSGGQTGVDRAALDAAMVLGLPVGGWCPKGRRAEDGVIDLRYPLIETPDEQYAQRTAWNVRDSDGTLVFLFDKSSPGTNVTIEEANALGKALLLVDLTTNPEEMEVLGWLEANGILVLNVAGPRESEAPGIYEATRAFLDDVFGKDR
ncbi:MAG: putative molybdenum carrier protein [Bacteroidetes bacterium]|nr:putative molybdenum carrier protein [Bacteroidota bacterium]